MISLGSAPDASLNFEPISRNFTDLPPSSSLAMMEFILSILSFWIFLAASSLPLLRGKTASNKTLVVGDFFLISSIMPFTPSAISSAVLSVPLLLLVPIINCTTFGLMPSSSPFCKRQITCWVRSPPIPKFAAFIGTNLEVNILAPEPLSWPSPPQASVMESPRKRRSTLPRLAIPTKASCRFSQFLSRGVGLVAEFSFLES